MKRLVAFICAAAMLLGICSQASAAFEWTSDLTGEFAVYEDFASESVVQIKKAANWAKSGTRGPYYQNGIMYMMSEAGDGKDTNATRKITKISSGKAVLDFDICVTAGGAFNIYTCSAENVQSRIEGRIKDGKPYMYVQEWVVNSAGESGNSKTAFIDSMEYNTWYNVSVVYDLDSNTVDYYVDNQLKLSDTKIYNNNTLGNIASVIFSSTNSVTTNYSLRNLKIGSLTDKLAMHYDSYNTAPSGLDNVKDNLTLAATGKYGSAITWSSSNEEVISSDGTVDVSKASGGADGETVTLTASYSLNNATYQRAFAAKVYPVDEETVFHYDDFTADKTVSKTKSKNSSGIIEKVTVDGKSAMHIYAPKGSSGEVKVYKDSLTGVTKKTVAEIEFKTDANKANILFVQSGTKSLGRLMAENGKLVWKGSGVVTLTESLDESWHNVKAFFDTASNTVSIYFDNMLIWENLGFYQGNTGDITEVITLLNAAGEHVDSQSGNIWVDYVKVYSPKNQTVAELVASAIELPAEAKKDINLPTAGTWGAQIEWESYDEDYITADGAIASRPAVGESAYSAELEATVTYGMGTASRSAYVDVLPYEEIEYTYSITDENGNKVSALTGIEKVNLTLNMDVNTSGSKDMFISVAAYNGEGRLISIDTDNGTLSGRGNKLSGTVELTGLTDVSYVKCFIWENQTPYVVITPIQ